MRRFTIEENGYSISEVNRFIDLVIDRIEKLNNENSMYLMELESLKKKYAEKSNLDGIKLEKALLAVQETSDKMKQVSIDEANIILEEAKNNANAIVHEALLKAEKIDTERMILEKNIRVYKERIKSLLEAELKIVDDLDSVEL